MRLHIAGGCGEHGRNCFLLEGAEYNVMVDCGVMAGAADPLPRLTPEQIQRTRYVFLTHSHADHTGAVSWLVESGFQGSFFLTAETALQLPMVLPKATILTIPEETETLTLDGLKVKYGMSGHCAGSLWYLLHWEDKRCFFSGDYNFYSYVYKCQLVRDRKADAAVIDSCYTEDEANYGVFAQTLSEALHQSGHVLLPVPKYGRGLEILLLLMERFGSVCVTPDSHLLAELHRLKSMRKWIRPDAYKLLRQWKPRHENGKPHVLLLSDPQLKTEVGQYIAKIYVQENQGILLSGHVDEGSFAKTLLDSGKAKCSLMPVHNSDAECKMLKNANRFKRSIPYHTTRLDSPEDIEL